MDVLKLLKWLEKKSPIWWVINFYVGVKKILLVSEAINGFFLTNHNWVITIEGDGFQVTDIPVFELVPPPMTKGG